jgi:hypothetical protein
MTGFKRQYDLGGVVGRRNRSSDMEKSIQFIKKCLGLVSFFMTLVMLSYTKIIER